MSDTSAALKAAREVQSDTLAPELYRQANEWFVRSKREYKLKNFAQAEEYAKKAKFFAEQAEFEAMRNGAKRVEYTAQDPLSNQSIMAPHIERPMPPPAPVIMPPEGPPPEDWNSQHPQDSAGADMQLPVDPAADVDMGTGTGSQPPANGAPAGTSTPIR